FQIQKRGTKINLFFPHFNIRLGLVFARRVIATVFRAAPSKSFWFCFFFFFSPKQNPKDFATF
ncbi:hypothetical protein, partial [Winogradskyella sp.]